MLLITNHSCSLHSYSMPFESSDLKPPRPRKVGVHVVSGREMEGASVELYTHALVYR